MVTWFCWQFDNQSTKSGDSIWSKQLAKKLFKCYIILCGLLCQRAKLHARIKPTALCSAFDKENLIEFLLDSVHYIYMKSNPNPSF